MQITALPQEPGVWTQRECPECGGEGSGIAFEGPGAEYGKGFIPREVVVQCDECEGTGVVDYLDEDRDDERDSEGES